MILEIGFSRPKKRILPIYSWAIRAIYRTSYSHVYIRWTTPRIKEDVVYQASGTKINLMAGSIFDKNNYVTSVYEVDITSETYRNLLKYCLQNAGVDYGSLQAVGIGIQHVFNLKKNPFSNGSRAQVCSELVGRILEQFLGTDFSFQFDDLSPRDIKETLERSPHFRRIYGKSS